MPYYVGHPIANPRESSINHVPGTLVSTKPMSETNSQPQHKAVGRAAGAKVLAEPEDKPWHLREFRVADLDGNQFRVFYDFNWELQRQA